MKKKISFILVLVSVLLIVNWVRNDSTDTCVYTSKSPSEVPLYLYVDDKYMGELPHLDNKVIGELPSSEALNFPLKYGTHTMTAKDKNGKDVSSLRIKVARNSTTSSGLIGGHSQTFRSFLSKYIIVDML